MLSFNFRGDQQFYSEKYNSNNIINDIKIIEKLEKNDKYLKPYLKPYLIKNNTDDYQYDIVKCMKILIK